MKKNDLTVVVINDFDYIQGGASKVALDTAQILHDDGINVIFFSATHKENNYKFKQISTNQKECLQDGIKGAVRGLYNFKAAMELKKLLKKLDKDKTIIHIHGWTKSLSSSIFRVIQKMNFKAVLTLHDYFIACPNGGFFNYRKCQICKKNAMSLDCMKTNCDSRNYFFKIYRLIRQYIQNQNVKKCKNLSFINISDFSLDKLEKYIKKDINISKVYNPISIEKNARAKVEENDYYLYVGRVSKEKGVDVFCEAIDKLKLKAIIVGEGSEKLKLQKEYENSNIQFVGWKATNDVYNYMKKSKCLIFTSLWYETMGLTILEAKSNGVPCIVSKNTAGSEFVRDKKEGLLYNGTVEDLTKKITMYEKSDIKKMSINAYENYWNEPLNEERYLKHILEFYKKM